MQHPLRLVFSAGLLCVGATACSVATDFSGLSSASGVGTTSSADGGLASADGAVSGGGKDASGGGGTDSGTGGGGTDSGTGGQAYDGGGPGAGTPCAAPIQDGCSMPQPATCAADVKLSAASGAFVGTTCPNAGETTTTTCTPPLTQGATFIAFPGSGGPFSAHVTVKGGGAVQVEEISSCGGTVTSCVAASTATIHVGEGHTLVIVAPGQQCVDYTVTYSPS